MTYFLRATLLLSLAWQSLLAAPPVSGPTLHLDAGLGIVGVAGKVQSWQDQSGNGHHFEQATAAKQPVVLVQGIDNGSQGEMVVLSNAQNGNTWDARTLGLDFIVEEPVEVSELAVFDHLRDGLSTTLTVGLWQRGDGSTKFTPQDDTEGTLLETLEFTAAAPGELRSSYRWKSLSTPRVLSPGSYTIAAAGYNSTNLYFQSANNSGGPTGRGIRWVGESRYSSGNGFTWPNNVNGTWRDYYAGASNLRFTPVGGSVSYQPAIQFDGVDDGLQALSSLNLARPSTVFVAYERDGTDFGYVFQNTSGPHWFLRTDGYYSNGWINYETIPTQIPQVATMVSTASGTRAFENGQDITNDGSLTQGTPGRLALGGGSGLANDPIAVRIAEVIAYNRELNAEEIRLTHQYLGEKYGAFSVPLANPTVEPATNVGTGNVTVTLSSEASGGTIRYTFGANPADPTEASAAYTVPFSVPRGTTVKARVFKSGEIASGVVSQVYTQTGSTGLPLGGLLSWHRGDLGLDKDANGLVSRWRDLTGNGNDFVQANEEQRPQIATGFETGDVFAIETLYGTEGSNTHNGALGADFEVTEELVISDLAAFDHRGDGFGSAVTVQLWSRNDKGTPNTPEDDVAGVLLEEMEFTTAVPGTLDGSYRTKPLAAPRTLQPGHYTILGWGFTGTNLYRNSSDASWPDQGLRFVNRSRYSNANGTWPSILDSHPAKYNGTGNFKFSRAGVTPESTAAVRFDGVNDGLQALPTSNIPRPSTVYVVYERFDDGIIMQSTSGGWWFIRGDGAYVDGWVVNRTTPRNLPIIAGFTNNAASGSRFYLNGEDWTVNPSVGSAPPGRMTLGGGEGNSIDPASSTISELLTFDRVLNQAERWQIENYLSERYRGTSVAMPPVAISPASNIGSGNVTVTLSSGVPGSTIRYTTNNTEPNETSTLYTSAINVPRGTTVKAKAFLAGVPSSATALATYGETAGPDDLPVTGAKAWLRSDRGVELDQTGGVSRWLDLTGNGNHFEQTSSAQRPALRGDGLSSTSSAAMLTLLRDGTNPYAGSLGDDFEVTESLDITHLGAFDHRRDGFGGTITVELWSRNNNGTPSVQTDDTPGTRLALLTFTSSSPGELDQVYRYKPLTTAVTLPPGSYTIFSHGYVGEDRYHNGAISTESGDPRFNFTGLARYSPDTPGGAWPALFDNARFANTSNNFKVSKAGSAIATLPTVVFDGVDDGLQGVESMNFGRESTVLIAFERSSDEFGSILQNTTGNPGHWFIRTDGYYTNGWTSYQTFPVHSATLATMVNSPGGTRAYRNGYEVTENSALTSANPGRLAMGGGEGLSVDPSTIRVSELIVFDRALNDSELWQIQNYMARRHDLFPSSVNPVAITPPSDFGVGNVNVSLSTTTPGATIRYTVDGAEPTATSTLYAASFSVPRGTTVKARAFVADALPSGISTSFYGDAAANPIPVSGSALWLRADQGLSTFANGGVNRWADLSGNGRDFIQVNPFEGPLAVTQTVGGAIRNLVKVPAGTNGSVNYAGWVGTDFIVKDPVEITELGAFDTLANGFPTDITVRLHRVNDNGTPSNAADDSSAALITTMVFSSAQPGVLDGATRFKPLTTPITLLPGRYFIESSGWNGANQYINGDTEDELTDYEITFPSPSISRYSANNSSASAFPGTILNDRRYLAAAGVKFRRVGTTGLAQNAVRFDGIDDGLLGPEDFSLGRPSTVFLVYNQLDGTDGRLMQSASGQNWLLGPHIGTDGLFANGWVTQHTISRNVPSISVAVQDTDNSRYYYNGNDLTQSNTPIGNVGRIAFGGAEGVYNQPCNADLAEVIVYDRLLSPLERQRVSKYLQTRYQLPLEPIQEPIVTPDGGYFSAGQTVSISHPETDPAIGLTIRYTQGSSLETTPEPTESSTLYTSPFVVSASSVVKAKAFANGFLPSSTASSDFIISNLAITPPQRANLQLWLRAGVGMIESANKISIWRDLSGKGQDATQTTAVNQATLDPDEIGGVPAVVFDGSSDFFNLPQGFRDFSQGLTAMFVVRPAGNNYYERFLDLGRTNDTSNMVFGRYQSQNAFHYDPRSYSGGIITPNSPDNFQNLGNQLFTVSQQSNGAVKVFRNGELLAEDATFQLPIDTLRTNNLLAYNRTWGTYFNGAIGEIILYNKHLTDLERESLEIDVRSRFGIASTIASTATFSPDPAALYPSGVNVTLASLTPNARIHYTLDGSTPSETSPLYTAPISLTVSARVRARTFADDFNASQFSEATYLIGQPPSSGDGLLATYYDNLDFTGSSLIRVDPLINFTSSNTNPDPAINYETFSVRWTGKVIPRFSENFTFFGGIDDGMRIWIDLNRDGDFDEPAERIFNFWPSGGEQASAPVPLTAGLLYNIKVESYNNFGPWQARVLWSSFSETKAPIPQSQLFSDAEFSQTASTPVISPASGTYITPQVATITTATSGATLYFTIDGSEPSPSSQVYAPGQEIPIGADTTVRARAYRTGFNPSGVATAIYDIDAQPPVIGSFTWENVAIANGETFTNKGILGVTATDNQGISRAEFYYEPNGNGSRNLIGTDSQPGNGMSMEWNISSVADGSYKIIARVFDTSGAFSEIARNVSVALALPPAPSITAPVTGASVQDAVVALTVQSTPVANIRIFRDGLFIFSGFANSSGILTYNASLPTGTSAFKAVAQNRAGPSPDSNSVSITRVREFPQLELTFPNNTITEGSSLLGTVSLPSPATAPVTFNVGTNKASQFQLVEPVIIPIGQSSATFSLIARQDSLIELLSEVTITVSATEHRSDEVTLFLADDDYPDIALELDAESVAESHGTVMATIRRAVASDRALRVELVNSNPGEATLPEFIDIPANETSRVFNITINDDTADDGNQIANIQGIVRVSDTIVASSAIIPLEVRDDEGALLAVTLANPFIAEGGSISGTVTRSGTVLTSSLTVNLSQSPAGQLTLPASVVIPANQSQASFNITALTSPSINGTRNITVRASAATFTDGLTPLTITDTGLPELTVSNLTAPASALTETNVLVNYAINNLGFAPAVGPYLERIFLSKDTTLSENDVLVRQTSFTGQLANGASYGRSLTVLTPREIGTYYVIVTVDGGLQVEEIQEDNNTTVLLQQVEVRPAYNAVVQTASEIIPANTPITLTGSATRDNGTPSPFTMVNIHIGLNGTNRVISAVTNSIGLFSTTWTPLRNEGGSYTIGASHPGTLAAPVQDQFEILTLGVESPGSVNLNEAETAVTQAVLRNPNGRPLTGVNLSFSGAPIPPGLTITPLVSSSTIAAGGELIVPITVTAAAGFSGSGNFVFNVTTAEGVTMQGQLSVRIELLKPVLHIEPASLTASVLRGESKSQSFTITNTGGLATGAIQILTPAVSWINLVSSSPLPSLNPGESTTVSLNLNPDNTVPLTQYSGNLAVNAANGGSRNVNYTFRVVTDLRGDLEVEVVNELFFFTAGSPKLEGAKVIVRDAISSIEIAQATTPVSGTVTFPNLPEGWYRLDVSALEHDSFTANYYVNAGQTNRQQIFISKQLVKYSWTVEEIEIEDVYRVQIETTFETNVPAPVVTANPSTFDVSDLVALGQTKTINVTLQNHGFIAAQNSEFEFSEHPFYEFTPLVTNVGTIPAKSSIVVPVTITRKGIFDENGDIVTLGSGARRGSITHKNSGGGSVPCGAGGKVKYNFPCGQHLVEKIAVLAINGIQGNCGSTGGGGWGGGWGGGGSFWGGFGGSSGPGGGTSSSGPGVAFSSPDPCLNDCILKATLDCLIGFTPIGCFYGIATCASSLQDDGLTLVTGGECTVSILGCALGPVAGAISNGAGCIYSYTKCYTQFGGGGGSSARNARTLANQGYIFDDESRSFAPEMAESWERVETIFKIMEVVLGSKTLVEGAVTTPEGRAWLENFNTFGSVSSDASQVINPAETAVLLTNAEAAMMDEVLVQLAIDRWNRTLSYGAAGISRISQVPAGDSTDFIDIDRLAAAGDLLIEAFNASQALGYADPYEEFLREFANLREELEGGQGGTCAKVKIAISQDVVMTRTAFRATLNLENERTDGPISDVGFTFNVRDSAGLPAEDLFNISVTNLSGLAAIDGTGEIPAAGQGSAQWTLIPRDTAALEAPTGYTIGGTIRYMQGGTQFTIPVENVPITVRPDASLDIKYFHQRDVLSDDPYTDVIEPAQPYKLAVMVSNDGFGEARNLKIISGQPKIIDNEKGLFIDFKIIGTEVDGVSLTPSLTADFGNLAPGQKKIATWLMTSTLQGLFTEYSATFEHVTGLGDPRISLLKNVEIHEMIRMVREQGPGSDNSPDFLVNDVADANDYPDTVHYSDGGSDSVTLRQTGIFSGAPSVGTPTITVNLPTFSGWSYFRLPDPGNGNFRLISVTRNSDGRVLPLDFNVWQSDRTFIGRGRRPVYENIFHLADKDGGGLYSLTYAAIPTASPTPPTSAVTVLPAQSQPDFSVFWSGNDDEGIAHYDVYLSTNGGPYSLWKDDTVELGGVYPGTIGNTYSFYSRATDVSGNQELKTPAAEATTLVANTNQPPIFTHIPDTSITEGDVFLYTARASDPDGATSNIRFAIGASLPGFVINPATGEISWNSSETDGGKTATVTVVATDSGTPAAVANETFVLTINDVNTPPSIVQVGPQTLAPGTLLVVDADATDGDEPEQSLTFSFDAAPPGATIAPATGLISWTPTNSQAAQNFVFTVRVTDSGSPAQFATMSFSVQVNPSADNPPAFTNLPVVLWVKGQTYSLTVSAADPDGDAVTLAANLTGAAGATFGDHGDGSGSLSWNTAAVTTGTYNIPVTASANGKSASGVVKIRIADDNLYWRWVKETFGDLPNSYDLANLEMNVDLDGDLRTNLHEMAMMTNPRVKDEYPVKFSHNRSGRFGTSKLKVHRRKGSAAFVNVGLRSNDDLQGAWRNIPSVELSVALDATGDDDGNPNSESMEFTFYEFYAATPPKQHFFQVRTTNK